MSKEEPKLTPAMKQFHHFKAKYPDAVLFFRMGDFYETFYEDAEICSRVLGLTLTSRNKNSDCPIPLAGLPFHAVDGYMKKMIQAGYKVAVCEQVEDPKTAVGVVKRDVVRVITPGTLTDDILLDGNEDNFLCSIHLGRQDAIISWVDISTGHFFVQRLPENRLIDELISLSPRECLLPEKRGELFAKDFAKLAADIKQQTSAIITERPGWYFDYHNAEKNLLKHFGTNSLEGFGIFAGSEFIPPAGAIIEYLKETQKTTLGHIGSVKVINRSHYLQIDQTSRRSLEILRTIRSEDSKGSLLASIDYTLTGMGSRKLRSWICMPLYNVEQIQMRQDAVDELRNNSRCLESIRYELKNFADLERIAARISTYRTGPKDLLSLAATLSKVQQIRELVASCQSSILNSLAEKCDSMDELAALIENAILPDCPTHLRDGGVINTGFNEKLDHLRTISTDGKSWLSEYQQREISRTGLANLKIGYNKVFGYYIELSRSVADKVPMEYIRKQTIKNAERYITEELKEYEEQVLGAHSKALELEQQLFAGIQDETTKYINRLQALAEAIANIDCLVCFSELALKRAYVRPVVDDSQVIEIIDGKHPVVAESLGNEFVSNDVQIGEANKDVVIITGPNMSGKSTYIRQTALLVLMAQTGSFIPAESARIGLVDKIFTRVGASDELAKGQSTFMVEMTETANIVNNATNRSLVILDEVGRGTSTYDGLSLAWAITEYIANTIGCRTLFATHYHELTELSEILANVKNCNVAVREWNDEVVFLHKILAGGTDKSYGVYVAKLAGLPQQIVSRSREILTDLESTFSKEAQDKQLSKNKTVSDEGLLFVERNKSVLDRLKSTDVNNLTPLEAINLLNQIKKEIE